jgi:hypothetical protein
VGGHPVSAPAQPEARCRLTELYVSQCAHCRHIEAPARVATSEVGLQMRAQYDGTCMACLGPIRQGEMIGRLLDGGGWACEGCLP